MADDNSTDDIINDEERENTGASRAARKAGEKAKQKAKKAAEKAKEAHKKGKYAKGIGKILWPVFAIIIIIVMLIGFIMFAINMPGAVTDKIINGLEMAKLTIDKRWTEKDLSTLRPEDLKSKKLELLNYLRDMGYDVVGMGFVQSIQLGQSAEDENKKIIIDFEEDITNSSEINNNGTGSKTIQPSYLFSYYLANERIYVTKHLKLINSILKNSGVESTWGEGMLNIYGDESVVDSKEVDRENLTLTFKNTHGFFNTDVYQYNIDGWAGRYGTPLELLLAIHSSTMMPDLVYEFVSNENLQTVVNINAQEVKLKVKLKLNGPDGEESINIGSTADTAIPIEFVRNDATNEYSISNIAQIKQGLHDGTYTLASLYKGFECFEQTFNDAATAIGPDATQRKIEEIINMSSPYFYDTYNPDINKNGEINGSVLYGSYYLGTTSEVVNGANLYNGVVKINNVDKSNKKITYTESINGRTSTIDDILCKSVALTHMANALKNNDEIIDWTTEERFSDTWKRDIIINYKFIFEEIDKYIGNLVDGDTIDYSSIVYDTNNPYENRFENWVYNLSKPLEFNEYINQAGLQSANQYEKDGKYKNYLNDWANAQTADLNSILNDINYDLNVEKDTRAIARSLKSDLARELGLTVEQVNVIYENFLVRNPEIQTFVPQIESVVKHWYKDLVFKYKNTAKGSVFEAKYPGEGVSGYDLYYVFETLDDKYPVQDGEPYVIKGDIVTQKGKEVSNSDIPISGETAKVLEDYTLGTGYKTARKLFTQGYYYQYDGSEQTAYEISCAKKIESYPKGTQLKVALKNSRLYFVKPSTEHPTGTEIHRYADKNNNTVETKQQADVVYDTYYIIAPGAYVSAAEGDQERTEESVKNINNLLKKLGTGIRRKKVSMSNNTTSLAALSMLEGMHSLDADYIYREFKEFLIELGYYSRAELDAVDTNVLDWFIPQFTPDAWPPIKDDEQMLEYGTILTSSANIKDKETIRVDKVTSLDNFIFYSDTDGIFDMGTLQTQGTNVRYSNTVNASSIVSEIISSNPAAICLYVNGNAKDDVNAIVKTKKLIEDIRAKLKEKEYKSVNLPIYVLQIIPLDEPDILAEASKEVVDQNKRISDYNTNLYSVCLNQDNVQFVDATSGCVSERGWKTAQCSATRISENLIKKVVRKNVSNGGFEEGLDVLTPGAGYIRAISDNEITIEFSIEQDHALKSIDKFTMIISGIAVDTTLTKDSELKKGTKIGVTTTEDIKLIMRDKNKAIIGNIEDYMPLPKNKNGKEISEWELLYFLPKESGALNRPGSGVDSVGGTSDEVAVGIIQWTTMGGMNNVSNLCYKLAEKDPELCGGLQAFSSWTSGMVLADINSGASSQIRQAFTNIRNRDEAQFLALQVECMKEDYGGPPAGNEWILERRGVVYGTYISARLWAGVNCGVDNVINSSMSDEQLVSVILKKARESKGYDERYEIGWNNRVDPNNPGSQMAVAMGILNGEYTEEEIEDLVRNGY